MNMHCNRPNVALIIDTSLAHGRDILLGVSHYLTSHQPWSIYVDQRKLNDPPPTWLEGWTGNGVIMRAQSKRTQQIVAELGVPAIDALNFAPGQKCPSIISDHHAIARLAVDHLLERRFRHFAFVGVERALWSASRRNAVVEVLREAGHCCHVYSPLAKRFIHDGWEAGQLELTEWLHDLPKPVGVIAAHDLNALCVLDACRREELLVPEQVAVVGVDNDEVLCSLGDPPLTSVKLNAELIGYESAAMLERLMKGKKPPAKPILIAPLGVVSRRSTDTVAIDDPIVAQAMRFIQNNFSSDINVDLLATHCGASRRHIERAFSKCLGSTPNEHILRAKLSRAKQLLMETDYSLDVVAEKSGFTNGPYLSNLFKKKTGMTPGQFRRQSANGGSKFSDDRSLPASPVA